MSDTNYAGIDYGLGMSNVDPTNGIRYGVIPQGEVLQAWADSSEAEYPECESETCEKQGYCECEFEPLHFYFAEDGYEATCGDDGTIFIIQSPYYTRAQYCSPCAPGAGYLLNPCDNGPKTYCFGHDWFENGKAPYPVYKVSDDTLVTP